MDDERAFDLIRNINQRSGDVRQLMRTAGVVYGVVFGIAFAFFTWGYDAFVIGTNSGSFPWMNLVIGLPLVMILCAFAGWMGSLFSTVAAAIVVWMITAGLLALLSAHVPVEGQNLLFWLMDDRLWGEAVVQYTTSAQVRTTLMIFISVLVGAVVGFFQNTAVNWAWDRATPQRRMSFPSWVVLLVVAIPVALLPASVVNGFYNTPMRLPQSTIGKNLQLTLSGEAEHSASDQVQSSYRSFMKHQGHLQDGYTTYFVTFGTETGTWYSAYIDIVFEDGYILRCVTNGDVVIYCDDFTKRMDGWVAGLVESGLYDEQPWLEDKMRKLVVDDSVVAWLANYKSVMGENYEWRREEQYSGWVFVSVHFDTGFTMTCRFRSAQPVVVDQCVENAPK